MAAEPVVSAQSSPSRPSVVRTVSAWLGGNRLGLVVMALVVGAGAGLGAALFREMIFGATWLVTGHNQFGQQGHAASTHLPGLGIWFVLIVPVLGGLIYGPLIYRFAREARGHGVPEVMLAVAENGGRIRPQVTVVKAVASAITIGVGGSVGREGPIVQIGSALASTLGQLVRMSESRLRIIVACGAAGGIAATFNAPLTGLFFGFEIVLREFSLDALVATSLAAVTGDVISRAIFGSAPFFAQIPHGLSVTNDTTYLLVAVLAVLAGLIGDRLQDLPVLARGLRRRAVEGTAGVGAPGGRWHRARRPAARGPADVRRRLPGDEPGDRRSRRRRADPAVPGQQGAGDQPHPVDRRLRRRVRPLAVHRCDGRHGVRHPRPQPVRAAVGPPALYAVVAMGGVFAAAAQAPLTAIASVAEMTGNFGITLPIMLTCGIAAAVSKYISYGSIYTTKLLRRGIDIERPKTTNVLQTLTVADAMQPVPPSAAAARLDGSQDATGRVGVTDEQWERLAGTVTDTRQPQELFSDETLEQALRQLTLYGPSGLPVLSDDREHLQGWITRQQHPRRADPDRPVLRAVDRARCHRRRLRCR